MRPPPPLPGAHGHAGAASPPWAPQPVPTSSSRRPCVCRPQLCPSFFQTLGSRSAARKPPPPASDLWTGPAGWVVSSRDTQRQPLLPCLCLPCPRCPYCCQHLQPLRASWHPRYPSGHFQQSPKGSRSVPGSDHVPCPVPNSPEAPKVSVAPCEALRASLGPSPVSCWACHTLWARSQNTVGCGMRGIALSSLSVTGSSNGALKTPPLFS